MYRGFQAIALIVVTFSVTAGPERPGSTPLSIELLEGNRSAMMLFILLGAVLVQFAVHCWRVGWKILSVTAGCLVPVLAGIAFTPPSTPIHLALFGVFLVGGICWMLTYAEADCQRTISILTGLLVFVFLALFFILAVVNPFLDASSISPLGLFQKGFILLLAALALRAPSLNAGQDERSSNSGKSDKGSRANLPTKVLNS